MRKLLLLPLLLISFLSFAQKWQVDWSFTDGAVDQNNLDAINAIDKINNNTFILGSSNDDFTFIKMDVEGRVLWKKSFGGSDVDEINDVISTSDGGFIGVGSSKSNDGNVPDNYGETDFLVVKLDFNGNLEWCKNFGGSEMEEAISVVETINNEYIISGTTNSNDYDISAAISGNSYDFWTIKLDQNGNIIWDHSYGGSYSEELKKMITTHDGNFLLVGSTNSIDFDVSVNYGSKDEWFVKIDPSGAIIWEKTIGTPILEGTHLSDVFCSIDNGSIIYISTYNEDPMYYPVPTINHGMHDIYLTKLNSNGDIIWRKNYGGTNQDFPNVITELPDTSIFMVSLTNSTDIDVTDNPNINEDFWLTHLDKNGNLLNEYSIPGQFGKYIKDIEITEYNSYIIVGETPQNSFYNWQVNGTREGVAFKVSMPKIQGRIYIDSNENCIKDGYEYGVRGLKMTIQPGNIVTQTDPRGYWFIDQLPAGSFTATIDTLTGYKAHCQGQINFTVSDPNDFTLVPEVGMRYPENCARPKVGIYSDPLNVCGNNQKIYIHVKNDLTTYDSLLNYAVEVELDSSFQPTQFSEAYSDLGNNTYSIDGPDLGPNESFEIIITGDISCNTQINQTLCMKATIIGADNCVLDTLPTPPITTGVTSNFTIPQPCTSSTWDNSSLEVHGWCEQDSVRFYITNAGTGNMDCYSPVFLYINDNLTMVDSVQIDAQDTVFYKWAAEGGAHVLQVEQHPFHPGKSHPTAFVEYCGNNLNQWQGSFTNNLPQNDQDQIVDVHCAVLNTSPGTFYQYGFPSGITADHLILPNQQMEYIIGFQNTTNDTVHHVVIRDTLDENLNIFSVRPGAQSHPFKFKLVDERILEWTLYNDTVAPSSQGNSRGFVSYSVEQNPNLPDGTIIKNRALVQLGNNAPQQTNAGQHKIYELLQSTSPLTIYEFNTPQKEGFIEVYPNPSNGVINIEFTGKTNNANYQLIDISGKVLQQGRLEGKTKRLDGSSLNKGVYVIQVDQKHNTLIVIQ